MTSHNKNKPESLESLGPLREEIDKIDDQLLDLFTRRMEIANQVGQFKKDRNLPVLNKVREREILERLMNKDGQDDTVKSHQIHRFFTSLFEQSRAYQNSLLHTDTGLDKTVQDALLAGSGLFPKTGSIACQGIEGAYSQIAAESIFPQGNIMFFKGFENVLEAVSQGLCQYGVLPIENSGSGTVRDVYDLLLKGKVSIVRSKRQFIRHVLLAKPSTKMDQLTEIFSHEQALSQCSDFLKSLPPSVKITSCANTAVAAKMASQSESPGVGAISSMDCQALYGLKALNTDIQNSDNNYTRFVCISKEPKIFPGANRIGFILELDNRPGALYDVLAEMSALEINMLKIESSPISGRDFEFRFLFEIEANVDEPRVLQMLKGFANNYRHFVFLGNYLEV